MAAVAAPAAAAASTVSAPVGSLVAAGSSPRQDEAALRAALQAVVDAGATGIIALVDDGERVSRLTVGAARLDPRVPVLVGDQARVGSITKTAIATIALLGRVACGRPPWPRLAA